MSIHRRSFAVHGAIVRALVPAGLLIGLATCGLFGSGTIASASTGQVKPLVSDANSVVAAYVVNFLRYVEWPQNVPPAGEPWRIGLLRAEGLSNSLGQLTEGKLVRGRPISVIRSTDPAALVDCHLVMLPESFSANHPAEAAAFSSRPILTVVYHEKETVTDPVMIELVLQGRKIRYRLNAGLLTNQGLKPTPGLLENALPPAAPVVRSP